MRVDGLPTELTQPSQLQESSQGVKQRDDFLKLLVAQLQHQDPLQPQEGADFVAQLAQFSSLEQVTQTNERLADLTAAQAANQRASLTQLVGRSVTADASTLQYDPTQGDLPDLGVKLEGSASTVEIIIKDSEGNEVKHIHLGATQAGETALSWDGTDDQGVALPAGTYTMQVAATDAKGAGVDGSTVMHGHVDSVKFDDGETTFEMGATVIQPGAIMSVEE